MSRSQTTYQHEKEEDPEAVREVVDEGEGECVKWRVSCVLAVGGALSGLLVLSACCH